MNELMDQLDAMQRPRVLSHIDSVADNFLFLPNGSVRLIDWEYAGMCDPLIDLSMCAIYSYYDEAATEKLMQIYFGREPETKKNAKSFIPTLRWVDSYGRCGPYIKASLGEEFGEYTLIMYRYAKTYYKRFVCCKKNVTIFRQGYAIIEISKDCRHQRHAAIMYCTKQEDGMKHAKRLSSSHGRIHRCHEPVFRRAAYAATGWQQNGSTYYYYDANGELHKGWLNTEKRLLLSEFIHRQDDGWLGEDQQ